ncbi:MAG: hypothetical protein KC417_16195, partial [Myxococcales bacterium]|nr:hypothetical protein [Myxococcales bacterium]
MRLKIIAGNIVVVLLTGIIGFLLIRGQVTDTLRRDITARVRSDARLFDRSWRLSAYEFLNQVENRASDESVRGAMASVGDSRRNRSFDAANDVAGWFQDPARGRSSRPSIVAITDSSGTVVARNQDKNRLNGTLLTKDVPAVGRALAEGRAQHDVWFKSDDGTLLQVGVAPIRNEQGAVVGTLLVGFELTGALAAREAQLLGCDIAFLNPKDIYSSSLDPQAAQNVQASLYGASGSGARTTATLTGGQGAFEWNDTVNGDDWTGVVGRLPMTSSVPVGYAVLADKTQAAGLAGVANIVLVLMAIGIVLVLIYGFVIGGSFLEPLEEIEEGVLAVI